MLDVIINVLAIIGIIIAGGFIVFFLGDLLLSVLDPARDQEKLDKRNEKEIAKLKKKIEEKESQLKPEILNEYNSQPVSTPYVQTEQVKPVEVKEEIKKEEPIANNEVVNASPINSDETFSEVDEAKAKQEEEMLNPQLEEERLLTERRLKEMEERRAAIFAEMEKVKEEEAEEEFEEELDLDNITFDEEDEDDYVYEEQPIISKEEAIRQIEEEETVEEIEDDSLNESITEEEKEEDVQAEESVMPVSMSEDQVKKAREEIDQLRRELEIERQKYEMLVKETEEAKNHAINEIKPEAALALTIEEYENKLAELQERLKSNEKELKICKKEFLPLMRVKKNLENDKKKLRRREAMVAKQKVVLYGVNNYADIDEEKAKKLAEDLDLLDGLKLSVQHCEEVMKNNSDRYPILETTYRILKENNDSIKADISEIEAIINRIKNENGEI